MQKKTMRSSKPAAKKNQAIREIWTKIRAGDGYYTDEQETFYGNKSGS